MCLTLEGELHFSPQSGTWPGWSAVPLVVLHCTASLERQEKNRYVHWKEGKFSKDGVMIDVQILRKKVPTRNRFNKITGYLVSIKISLYFCIIAMKNKKSNFLG